MKKSLGTLLLVAVAVGAVGYSRSWFTLTTAKEFGNNKVDTHLTVDPDKAKADVQKVLPLK